MSYVKRIDSNQNDIVKKLRAVGASVRITSMLGHGFPDIAVGYRQINYFFEIKDGNKPPSARKLTPDEQKFFDEWKGTAHKVESAEEALQIIGIDL